MRTLSVAVAVLASSALGAGFRLDTQDARATGVGGAVTAMSDDASSIFYNPAGIAGRKGLFARAGVSLIFPKLSFTRESDGGVTDTPFGISTPPSLYVAYAPTDWVALGLGIFTPFGAAGNWPEDSAFNTLAVKSSVQTFNFNPTLAFQFVPRFRVGGGINIMRGTVEIARKLDFVDSVGAVALGGGATGIGWNLGIQAEVIENILWFGASWRSGIDLAFNGRAHFTDIPLEFQSRINDQKITAAISLPNVGTLGFGVKASDRVRLTLDGNFVGWSSFQELRINFENPDLTVPLPKRWQDQMSVHLGAEVRASSLVTARVGFVWDPTPSVPSTLTPDLPDATRLKLCAGLGITYKGFTADVGYQFVLLLENRSISPLLRGNYNGNAHVLGITIGYDWLFGQAGPAPSSEPEPVRMPEPDPMAPTPS